MSSLPVEIIPYSEKYRDAFKKLNTEWLEKYFFIETFDNKVLSNPEKYILDMGGFIYFARIKYDIVGTCALMKNELPDMWELTKMAVTEKWQGNKIGEKIAQTVIQRFESFLSGTLFLETNSKLKHAIALYKKLGFVQQSKRKKNSHYQRADVYMIYKKISVT